MNLTYNSILNDPAISGNYLFPQDRVVDNPFVVVLDDAELACYQNTVDPESLTVIHFHGNGEAVADYIPFMTDAFSHLGLNSLFVEYREYGGSTGEAKLVTMLGDGEAVMHAARLSPEKVISFGRSIGSLYAIELAHRHPNIAGLILESGIADPLERFLKYADYDVAGPKEADIIADTRQYFDHHRKLSGYTGPLLILHAEKDGLVDITHAERNLHWAGSQQKQLVRFPLGNHNTIFGVNAETYLEAIRSFAHGIR